uniref:Uncharacterized protein n=1 Tax=Cacopsylla melanoneura TaxID=428564 RepID=A0A8D8Q1T9_9HEMI
MENSRNEPASDNINGVNGTTDAQARGVAPGRETEVIPVVIMQNPPNTTTTQSSSLDSNQSLTLSQNGLSNATPSSHPANNTRQKWRIEDYREVMRCYFSTAHILRKVLS